MKQQNHMEGKKAQKLGTVLNWIGVGGIILLNGVVATVNPTLANNAILQFGCLVCIWLGLNLQVKGIGYENYENTCALEESMDEEISMLKNQVSELKREMVELENEVKAHRAE